MKQLLILFLLSSTTSVLHAQPWDSVTTNRDMIFTRSELFPTFKGGEKAFKHYLDSTLNKSVPKKEGAPAGVYTVMVQFIVYKDGSVSDVKALTAHGYGMEAEAERVIKNTPRWVPAIQGSRYVHCYHKQAITFVVD